VRRTHKVSRNSQALIAFRISVVIGAWFGSIQMAGAAIPTISIAQEPMPPRASGMSGTVLGVDSFSSGGTFLYQAGFESNRWSGKLRKLAVTVADDGAIQVAALPEWDAADILSGQKERPPVPSPENRQIYIANADTASGLVEFKWDQLAVSQKAKLDASPSDASADGLGARRIDFLRGVRSDEIGSSHGIFRQRDKIMGDIVDSNLVHVGAPAVAVPGADYRIFFETYKNRAKAVYVGANDGMLHAFDASSGIELFAYIPQALIGGLTQLSRPDYKHRPFVDGAITVTEAQVQGAWKTVLAAGMGGGAQGIFALDVSNPADFKGGLGALWEFTDSDDPDMGNVLHLPVIARFNTRLVAGVPEFRYFVLVGSGVNNYLGDGHANPLAPAVLFLLSLDKKSGEPWQLGVNYFKFKKPILDTSLPNGLSSPTVILSEGGAVSYAYACDLQGNLWRFDFTGSLPWSKENAGTTPVFTALDAFSHRQPITIQPRVVHAPGGGYVILFGTGKFMEERDISPSGFSVQSFYGIYDSLQKSYKVSGRSQLEPRAVSKSAEALQFAGKEFEFGESADKKRGWYFDFPDSNKTGERSISNPLVDSGRLIFNSLIPCTGVCPDGGGRSYVLNPLTGMPFGKAITGLLSEVGMPTSPLMLQTSAVSSKRNVVGKAVTRRRAVIVNGGSGGPKESLEVRQDDAEGGVGELVLPAMRFSWREILNWQEFRSESKKK
jgi:type IV pilus assembly protein PilY1